MPAGGGAKSPSPGNSSDADYDAHKDDPNYIFEGYLLFDFFVTDEQGGAITKILLRTAVFMYYGPLMIPQVMA